MKRSHRGNAVLICVENKVRETEPLEDPELEELRQRVIKLQT